MPIDDEGVQQLVVGTPLGRWTVEEIVTLGPPALVRGRGEGQQPVLIKTLPMSAEAMDGVRREVGALRVIDSKWVPGVVDFGMDGRARLVWLAMKDFDGRTLAQQLDRGPLPWPEACAVAYQVCAALGEVHAAGMVHGDVCPSNILVGPGNKARLIGFDKTLSDAEILRRSASALAPNLAYAAPEVIDDPILMGARSDLYSVGVLLYEAVTGSQAFPAALFAEGDSSAARSWRQAPLDASAHVPEWLANLIRKLTEPSNGKRLPDAEAVMGWLDAAQAAWGGASSVTPAPAPPLQMAAPSIVEPSEEVMRLLRLAASPSQHGAVVEREPPPLLLYHTAAGLLGAMSALAFCSLVIVLYEFSSLAG